MKGLLRCAVAILIVLSISFVSAAKIKISTPEDDPTSLFEIRNAVLPNGTELEYFVVKGSPVTITIDEDEEIVAQHLEIDLDNKLIRIIGYGTITTTDETIQGENLIFNLENETFRGADVLIITEAIDVIGVDANRVPGQISVLTGRFSPCSRCEQRVQDYGFRAGSLELFPGDRLVAFDVTMLIRGVPILYFPIFIVPLGPPERQPRLSITSGTATERAEVFLDWPYVAGATAFGTTSLRYYADILPGQGNFFSNNLLGGSTLNSYLGAEINHRFYTDRGAGRFVAAYTPSFIIDPQADGTGSGKTDELYTLRFQYDTDPSLSGLTGSALISRDDGARQRLLEYQLSIGNTVEGVIGRLSSKGFFDLDPLDDITEPSFTPQYSLELDLTPETESFSVGPFNLTSPRLNLGFYQGKSNSNNRSAALTPLITTGRILESHSLSMDSVSPWAGFTVSGASSFQGQYYATAERLINWRSNLDLRQTFGTATNSLGSLDISLVRNISEGETPFRFDILQGGSEIYIRGGLSLTPASWISFSTGTRYVFFNNRADQLGFDPLDSRLSLFGNLSWISVEFANSYNLRDDDPGKLTSTLNLNAPASTLEASLTATLITDLDPTTAIERSGEVRDESEANLSLNFGLRPYVSVDLSGGYIFDPPELDPGELNYWKPLELGLTLGTSDQGDSIPGFRVWYVRDLNKGRLDSLGFELTAALSPFELRLEQGFRFTDEDVTLGTTNYGVIWRGVATFEASGFALLPPSWLGLTLKEERSESWVFNLYENRETGQERWRLTYQTDRSFTAEEVTSSNTNLKAFVNLEESRAGPFYFGVDFDATLILEDDTQLLTYLSLAGLDFFTDIAGVVGFQGTLGYSAQTRRLTDPAGEPFQEISQAQLKLTELALTVKLFDQLYVSTVLNDTWTLIGTPEGQSAFNFQPEFRVIWDRCCWALYSSWNTATGQVRFTLTTPTGIDGLGGVFETDLRLPGNIGNTP